jgi:hypothetical protein
MLPTIQLDDQFMLQADEIHDEAANGLLATEFISTELSVS